MTEGQVDAPARGLRESQFQALADTAPDAILIGDIENRIAYVNGAAEVLFGHDEAAMVGSELTLIIPERFRNAHRAALARFMETGTGTLIGGTVELMALHADGHEIPIELSLGSTGERGQRTVTAVIRDLTDRKRAERHVGAQLAVTEALAAARTDDDAEEQVIAALVRALAWDVGILWIAGDDGRLALRASWQRDPDATGPLVAASAELRMPLGEGMPGRTLAAGRPVWAADLEHLEAMVRRDLATGCGLRSGLWLPLFAEGKAYGIVECLSARREAEDVVLRDLLMTVAAQVSEHLQWREARRASAILRDRLTEDLQRSNDELASFAQVAAHDLRTPMATVVGFAELIDRRHGDALGPEGREFLQFILDAARSSTQLLDSLLASARAGAQAIDREHVHLESVVEHVRATLHSQVEATGARIDVGPLPAVVADRVQLSQVVQNLLSNAMKFVAPGVTPEVSVTAERDGPLVVTTVEDNGIGVTPEAADELFEMFRRGERADEFEGAGIGLGVCAKVIRRHGGRLWCEPAPGGGTRFRFALPAATT